MDAFHPKVLACRAGLKAAIEKGMSRIAVETDSKMLRLALRASLAQHAYWAPIFFICLLACKK